MSKTVFSISQSLLKSWMTLRRLPMNSLLASNQNTFSQKWECATQGGWDYYWQLYFYFQIVGLQFPNKIKLVFTLRPPFAPWRTQEASLGKLLERHTFHEDFLGWKVEGKAWRTSQSPLQPVQFFSLSMGEGTSSENPGAQRTIESTERGRELLPLKDLCPALLPISASRHLSRWDEKKNPSFPDTGLLPD